MTENSFLGRNSGLVEVGLGPSSSSSPSPDTSMPRGATQGESSRSPRTDLSRENKNPSPTKKKLSKSHSKDNHKTQPTVVFGRLATQTTSHKQPKKTRAGPAPKEQHITHTHRERPFEERTQAMGSTLGPYGTGNYHQLGYGHIPRKTIQPRRPMPTAYLGAPPTQELPIPVAPVSNRAIQAMERGEAQVKSKPRAKRNYWKATQTWRGYLAIIAVIGVIVGFVVYFTQKKNTSGLGYTGPSNLKRPPK
ncbi:hypothetical protein B0O99DRAFT_598564 [Bisporella sp. PMI_857]|nr:hypothetical protein B0O99DRAFT_598564 [Bisporella sp. PMI_857]